MFIIYDKWNDSVSKTLLHYDQPSNTAIIIIKGMYLLEVDMKIQNRIKIYVLSFISIDKLVQFAIDLFCRNSHFMRLFPVLATIDLMLSVCIGSIRQTVVISPNQIR